jgi:hypothetical protein
VFVVIAEKQHAYPTLGDVEVFGPFTHKLQAKDFADAHLGVTGDLTTVKSMQAAPAHGEGL